MEMSEDWLTEELNIWKNKSKIDNLLIFVRNEDNNLIFRLNKIEFSINCPKNYPKENSILWIELLNKNSKFNWLSSLNNYTIRKSPNLSKLLLKIEKEFEKKKTKNTLISTTKQDKILNFSKFSNDIDTLESFNIEYYTLRKKLEDNLLKVHSPLTSSINNIRRLYKGSEPGMIIIEEFMNILKKYKNKSIILRAVDNNIYYWNVKFKHFNNENIMSELKELDKRYGYDYIELDIYFHDKLFPMYPPVIKVVRPVLSNSLMHKIPCLKMVQLDYWNPTRNMTYIINTLYNILSSNACIEYDSKNNNICEFPDGSYNKLEELLVKLSTLTGIIDYDNTLDNVEYTKRVVYNKKNIIKDKKKYWKSGVGYGHTGLYEWDINSHVKILEEKDVQLGKTLYDIACKIQEHGSNYIDMIDMVSNSCLIKFIIIRLQEFSFLDADKNKNTYSNIFIILQNFIRSETIKIFDIFYYNSNIYTLIKNLSLEAKKISQLTNSVDDQQLDNNFVEIIINIIEMIDPIYNIYIVEKDQLSQQIEKENIKLNQNNNNKLNETYKKNLSPLSFSSADIYNNKYKYKSDINSSNKPNKQFYRRVTLELGTLMKSLPVTYDASIFFRHDENNLRVCRALVTGPHDTPYDSGCYIFDIMFPLDYPKVCPSVHFVNHHRVRFNPNLYDNGKVCLSLLGTWNYGDISEQWSPLTSTLYQVFLSIQALILVEEPYFNEPSYESSIGSIKGIRSSKEYNNNIRLYTMKYSILELLKNSDNYQEFKEVLNNHFTIKKERILKTCDKWVNDASNLKQDYIDTYNEIKIHLDKLNDSG